MAVNEGAHEGGSGGVTRCGERPCPHPPAVLGCKFTDSETGNTVHVSSDRVVITDKSGEIVTLKNPERQVGTPK